MKEMANHIPHGFTEKELEHYSRQIVLKDFGIKAQRKLKKAKICIVGAGGLGSPISIQLASMGVGHIRIIDRDIVETSNLQRQHLSLTLNPYPCHLPIRTRRIYSKASMLLWMA
jgi:hypothetical protein